MHKGRLLNVISGLVAIVKKLSNVSSLRDATPSTGSLTRLPMTDNHPLWHTRSSPTSARALLTVSMLVPLPASTQDVGKTKKGPIFIGLISIPALTVAFVSRFAQ
jgi:hypothetical protein